MRNLCHVFAADLDLLAADALPPGEGRTVEAHLVGCTACRGKYEQTRALCADLSVAGNAAGSADAAAWRLRNRVRVAISGTWSREGGRWLPALAMAGALALVALIVGQSGPRPPVSSPVPISSASPVTDDPPMTLLACEHAVARSDAALDQLLARDAARPLASGDELRWTFAPNALATLEQHNRLP